MTVWPPAAGVPARSSSRRPRLHLHVGLPKSGTTSLQHTLRHHRDLLARHGWCYPDAGPSGHFLAALEMTGRGERWGRSAEELRGRFARLVEIGTRAGTDVVISHEIFAQATPQQVADVVAACADFELHVVITVRDLGRVLPAAWQERVKNGHRGSFQSFADRKAMHLPENGTGGLFYRLQNLAEVMDRWGTQVPADRIHVVPCPPAGAPRDVLWQRFADALGLGADVVDGVDVDAVPRANESIGAAQVTFLRTVNAALDGRLREPYGDAIRKHWFAQKVLARTDSFKAEAPAEMVARFAKVSASWVEHVRASGAQVHGDLEDIVPAPGRPDARHPDSATDAEILAGIPEAVAEMLVEVMELRRRIAVLEAEKSAVVSISALERRPAARAVAARVLRPLREVRARRG